MTIAYEELLTRQLQWALQEGSMHFGKLIRILRLPANFDQQLQPFVRKKFAELWASVQETP